MYRAFLIVLLIASVGPAQAADTVHLWSNNHRATPIGSIPGDISINAIATGPGGFAIVGGFLGTTDFGGGPVATDETPDIFVAKFDSLGVHQWSHVFAQVSLLISQVRSVAIDASGSVVMVGAFYNEINFGGNPIDSFDGPDAFAVKFDRNGTHTWSHSFGAGALHDNSAEDVAIDANGDIVMMGYFSGRLNFGGGVLQSAGATDVFLAKLTAAGLHVWSKRFGNANQQFGRLLALDGLGSASIAGSFRGTLNLGGNPLVTLGEQAFVATVRWRRESRVEFPTRRRVDRDTEGTRGGRVGEPAGGR